MAQTEINVASTLDGSLQPSLFFEADTNEKAPLLVGLHTWSFDRHNPVARMAQVANSLGWHFLSPEFRGPNLVSNPQRTDACGSPLAKQDIADAIDYVCAHYAVDAENLFLLGCSGGGHMALLMAGLCPERFKAIASFVPITDLRCWAEQNENYRHHVLACCDNSEDEMYRRSPIAYLDGIARSNTKIFHGKYDPVVPVSHSLILFEQLMKTHPQSRVFLDVFDGGHQMDMEQALYWLRSQQTTAAVTDVTG